MDRIAGRDDPEAGDQRQRGEQIEEKGFDVQGGSCCLVASVGVCPTGDTTGGTGDGSVNVGMKEKREPQTEKQKRVGWNGEGGSGKSKLADRDGKTGTGKSRSAVTGIGRTCRGNLGLIAITDGQQHFLREMQVTALLAVVLEDV